MNSEGSFVMLLSDAARRSSRESWGENVTPGVHRRSRVRPRGPVQKGQEQPTSGAAKPSHALCD
jgi:hypothetical protein